MRKLRIFCLLFLIAVLFWARLPVQNVQAAGTNLAPSGIGYRWHGLTSLTSNANRAASTGINDNNLTTDVPLTGSTSTDDPVGTYEAAGVIWSTPQTLSSVNYINGSFDSNSNGVFTGSFGLQFTTDGVSWTGSGWSYAPTYPYDSPSAAKITYTFAGSATNVLGVRAVGQVHASDNSNSWHANAYEVQAFGAVAPTNTPTLSTTPTFVPPTYTPISPTATLTSADGTPYGGTPAPVPGTIEAENYNNGGEGIAYHDTTTGNTGGVYRTDDVDVQACTDTSGCGYNVGWVVSGEWLKYTVNATSTGTYNIGFRVATTHSDASFHLEIDGANVTGSVLAPNTGAYQTYATVTTSNVNIAAGQHVLRLVIDGISGVNINYITISTVGGPTATFTATNTSVPPTATFTATASPITPTFVPPTITATAISPSVTPVPTSSNTKIRYNLVGYVTGGAKTAILMTGTAISSGKFDIIVASTGQKAFTGNISTTSKGSWNSTYSNTYLIDFSTFNTVGTYYMQVAGTVSAKTGNFRIDSANNIYAALSNNGLLYFEAQRDGPNVVSTVLNRKASHLNDQNAKAYTQPSYSTDGNDTLLSDLTATGLTRDVSGGWFDAGDYIKFVYTAAYVDGLMFFGNRERASSASAFLGESRFGMDWLLKMWDGSTRTLYYQVGIGSGNSNIVADHDLWRLPEADDGIALTSSPNNKYIKNRPVLRAGAPGSKISPNLAGRLAAAYGLCYQLYHTSDPSYANQCLIAGDQVFGLANTSPGSLLTVSPHDYYPGDIWHGDMEWGAAEMALALQEGAGSLPSGLSQTDPNYYITQSANWAKASITDGPDTLNLYDPTDIGHFDLFKALGRTSATGFAVTQSDLKNNLNSQLSSAVSGASGDPFGKGFSSDDTVSKNMGLAVTAHLYDTMANVSTYRAYELGRLDWALGMNAWGTSFVIGAGSMFPNCPQHQIANLVGSLTGGSNVLKGAVVNGPNASSVFTSGNLGTVDGMKACPTDGVDRFSSYTGHSLRYIDDVRSWMSSEPADDYTMNGILAFILQLP